MSQKLHNSQRLWTVF